MSFAFLIPISLFPPVFQWFQYTSSLLKLWTVVRMLNLLRVSHHPYHNDIVITCSASLFRLSWMKLSWLILERTSSILLVLEFSKPYSNFLICKACFASHSALSNFPWTWNVNSRFSMLLIVTSWTTPSSSRHVVKTWVCNASASSQLCSRLKINASIPLERSISEWVSPCVFELHRITFVSTSWAISHFSWNRNISTNIDCMVLMTGCSVSKVLSTSSISFLSQDVDFSFSRW